jgi:protein-disulfide isomerase
MMTKEAKIMIGIAVVVVAGGVALFLANPKPVDPGQPVDSSKLIRDNSPATGKEGAKVTLVEFGDYQCPACAAAHPIIKQVMDSYKGNPDVSFVFRHFPLDIHPNAIPASLSAEAAGEQGKYWEMYDKLYQNQNEWASLNNPLDTFVRYAKEIGINEGQFKSAVEQRKHINIVNADYDDGEAAGVTSTPTFFLNGEKLVGVPDPNELKQKIDEKLK